MYRHLRLNHTGHLSVALRAPAWSLGFMDVGALGVVASEL
jgi:hypothetical protein